MIQYSNGLLLIAAMFHVATSSVFAPFISRTMLCASSPAAPTTSRQQKIVCAYRAGERLLALRGVASTSDSSSSWPAWPLFIACAWERGAR